MRKANAPSKRCLPSALLLLLTVFGSRSGLAQEVDISLEDLTRTEVSSVSRRNQSLSDVPAAAFVVTAEDIRRSGALTIPDVLRMVPGIQVAQIDSGRYAVTARGFNGRFANKLQVLVDGRSIYDPFFSGTVWEQDPIPLEDIERIEVIRGAGAAMWGVNAVNGVINIISHHSRAQPGSKVVATVGNNGQGQLYARQAGRLDADTTWKVSAQGRHAEPSQQWHSDNDSADRLINGVVDIRLDRALAAGRDLSLWANAGRANLGDRFPLEFDPANPAVLRSYSLMQTTTSETLGGRFRWLTDAGIESSLQSSLTSASTGVKDTFDESHTQFDIDYQGRYTFAAHDILWGLSHRTVSDQLEISPLLSGNHLFDIRDTSFTQRTSGIFLHDDWTLLPDRLRLGLGARMDYTNLGGHSFSPSATLMWTPNRRNTLWAKYSKAPRMPARAEQDVSITYSYAVLPPGSPLPAMFIASQPGSKRLQQETMEGLELGYRSQVSAQFSIDTSIYRYRYTDIVSGQALAPIVIVPYGTSLLGVQPLDRCNCANGWLTGAELSADWLLMPSWRMQFSYTWTKVNMDASDNAIAQAQGNGLERATPRHVASLRSQWNISRSHQLDAWLRGSSGFYRILNPYVTEARIPGYLTLDLRYAYQVSESLELAVSGRNLVGPRRIEYVADYLPASPSLIGPSLLLSARWKF